MLEQHTSHGHRQRVHPRRAPVRGRGRNYRRYLLIAQLLATGGEVDQALAELEGIRPLLVEAFGAESTQVRNLNKQIGRLRAGTAAG